MKPEFLLKTTLSSFCLLLLFFTAKLPLLASARDEVLDAEGEPLNVGVKYYVVSSVWGRGGGLKLETSEPGCPVNVAQEYSEGHDFKLGMPVNMSSSIGGGSIYRGSRVEFSFSAKPDCVDSSKWIVYRDWEGTWVGIGGPKDHPCGRVQDGSFMIQRPDHGFGYKIVFCPQDYHYQPRRCSDVGIQYDNGSRRLALGGNEHDPFQAVFIKADSDHAKSFNYIKQVIARGKSI